MRRLMLINVVVLLSIGACRTQDGIGRLSRDVEQEAARVEKDMARLHDAMVAGDPSAIRAFLYVKGDHANALVDAQTQRILANNRFARVVGSLDIDHGANPFKQYRIFFGDDFAFTMGAMGWEITGNRATVKSSDLGGTVKAVPSLIKVRGTWRIDLTPPAPPDLELLAMAVSRYAEVVGRTARDIEAGRLQTIQAVKQALETAPKFAPSNYTPDLVLSLPSQDGLRGAD